MRISDWSSDVCSSDLLILSDRGLANHRNVGARLRYEIRFNAEERESDDDDTQHDLDEQTGLLFTQDLQHDCTLKENPRNAMTRRSEERRVGNKWIRT